MTAAAAPTLAWRVSDWPELTLDDLYDLLRLRAEVFLMEQGPYVDTDGKDRHAHHLMGRLAQPWGALAAGAMVAYLRIVHAGHKYAEPSIGRVAVAAPLRGLRLGHETVARGLAWCDATWPDAGNRISAQAHLDAFYRGFGYQPVGDVYLEDRIPHLQMWRRPTCAAGAAR